MLVSLFSLSSSSLNSCEPEYTGTVLTAYNDCQSVIVRQECTAIDENAFARSNVQTVDCSSASQLIEIGHRAFIDCTKLTSIILPESLQTIGSNAFRGCTALQRITIPQAVSYIGVSAFKDCTGLSEIDFKCPLTVLSASIFSSCTNLLEFTLPSSITNIQPRTFMNCEYLQKINLPNDLEIIGEKAFFNTKIRKLKIPSKVQSIGTYAFSQCPWLEYVSLPDSLKLIQSGTFAATQKLYRIKIPKYLVKVESSAFINCKVRELNFPDTLTELGDESISECKNLQTLRLPSKIPKFGLYVFSGTDKICHLKVPTYTFVERYTLTQQLGSSRALDDECLTPLEKLPKTIPSNYGILTKAEIDSGITEAPIPPGTPEDPEDIEETKDTENPGTTRKETDKNNKPEGNNSGNKSIPTPKATDKPGDDTKQGDGKTAKIVGASVGTVAGVAVVSGVIVGALYFTKKLRTGNSKVEGSDDIKNQVP